MHGYSWACIHVPEFLRDPTYASFVRMFYQRIWDAMTATLCRLPDITRERPPAVRPGARCRRAGQAGRGVPDTQGMNTAAATTVVQRPLRPIADCVMERVFTILFEIL